MRKTLLLLCACCVVSTILAQQQYRYKADLKNIQNDLVTVELETPGIKETEAIFSFPKVIPGSYSEKNYGKFIENFTAFAANGSKLKVKKLNPNQYSISNANTLKSITYKVADTWDKPDKDFIFQPGGTNIEAGKNVVMNNFAFFGYFEGYKMLPVEVTITKPAEFYASTHLEVTRISEETDVLKAGNYVFLADNPIFYSKPDTTSFRIGNSHIKVAVISASGKVTSNQIAGYLKPMAAALQQFFKGLPVESYQFLYYFEDTENPLAGKKPMGGFGALEHNYSSLYFLPEMDYEPRLRSMVNEVSSHEFLHILTPLNLHSREIEDFDFINPKMSQHLWLYEGVTEYFSHLVQYQNKIITEKEFLHNMREKIIQAEEHGNFSMTQMSENVLTAAFKDKYSSVYNKGALVAMMLDILIREQTVGAKSLKSVILDLSRRYGPGKPFDDSSFFGEFVAASHPSVRSFIDKYIAGQEPLPYQEYFQKLGYEFQPEKKQQGFFIGKMSLQYDGPQKAFIFTEVERDNALGIKNGDLFLAADNKVISADNIDDVWNDYFRNNTDKPEAVFTVKRGGEEKKLPGRLYRGQRDIKNYLGQPEAVSAAQKALHDQYASLD